MNRRRRKKQSVDYFEVIQNKLKHFDFKTVYVKPKAMWVALPLLHKRVLMVLVPVVLILSVIPLPSTSSSAKPKSSQPQRISLSVNAQDLSQQEQAEHAATSRRNSSSSHNNAWVAYTVQNGDTLSKVFRRNDLPISDLNALVRIEGSDHPLSNIKPGQLIRYKMAQDGKLDILQLEKEDHSVMFFRLSNGTFGRSK